MLCNMMVTTARVCGRSLAGIAGSNSAGTRMPVSLEGCALSESYLRFGLMTRPEEFYRLWCVRV